LLAFLYSLPSACACTKCDNIFSAAIALRAGQASSTFCQQRASCAASAIIHLSNCCCIATIFVRVPCNSAAGRLLALRLRASAASCCARNLSIPRRFATRVTGQRSLRVWAQTLASCHRCSLVRAFLAVATRALLSEGAVTNSLLRGGRPVAVARLPPSLAWYSPISSYLMFYSEHGVYLVAILPISKRACGGARAGHCVTCARRKVEGILAFSSAEARHLYLLPALLLFCWRHAQWRGSCHLLLLLPSPAHSLLPPASGDLHYLPFHRLRRGRFSHGQTSAIYPGRRGERGFDRGARLLCMLFSACLFRNDIVGVSA